METIDIRTILPIDFSLIKVYDSMKNLGKTTDRLPRKRNKNKKNGRWARKKIVIIDKNNIAESRWNQRIKRLHLQDNNMLMETYLSGLNVIKDNRIELDMKWFLGKLCLELKGDLDTKNYDFTSLKSTDYIFPNEDKRQKSTWTTAFLLNVPVHLDNDLSQVVDESWSIKDTVYSHQFDEYLLFLDGKEPNRDFVLYNNQHYFRNRQTALQFLFLSAFLYLHQEITFNYVKKTFP